MSQFVYAGGILIQRWDDATRLYTAWDETGAQTEQRPYTPDENMIADAVASAEAEAGAAATEAAQENAILDAIAATSAPPPDGEEWVQPTGAHDAYRINATVTHGGKQWTSTVDYNVWEPGVSGWVESGPGIPDWVQPTGAHDAYPLGAIVRHNGLVWQSNVDANVWEPPTQWTEVS
jgi:hypothetical protein